MRAVPDVEIERIIESGKSEWRFEVKQAEDGSKLLRQKADYNQISGYYRSLENAKSASSAQRLENRIGYIKHKANCNEWLQDGYDGKVNNVVEELRKIKTDGYDALSDGDKQKFKDIFKDEVADLLANLNLENNKKSRLKVREQQKVKFVEAIFEQRLQEKIAEIRADHAGNISELELKIRELIVQKPFDETRVVWASPTQAINMEQQHIDQFLYSGSTVEKTVFIPFRDIHKRLMEDSYRLRNGEIINNIIVGSFVFVISEEGHPDYKNLQEGYEGGRTYVEIPIIADASGWIKTGVSSDHSEAAMKKLFETDSYIDKLFDQLKAAIKIKLNMDDVAHIKIYQTILLLNSELNVCKEYGCSKTLYEMQRGLGDSVFLAKLQEKLLMNDFILSRKPEGVGLYQDGSVRKLRMQTSYAAGRFTASDNRHGGLHPSEAKAALQGKLSNISIDVHSLDAEVVLETPNWAICDIGKSEYQEVIAIREQRNELFKKALLEHKGLEETLEVEKQFREDHHARLNPVRSGFASGRAAASVFELESWGSKVLSENNDQSQFL